MTRTGDKVSLEKMEWGKLVGGVLVHSVVFVGSMVWWFSNVIGAIDSRVTIIEASGYTSKDATLDREKTLAALDEIKRSMNALATTVAAGRISPETQGQLNAVGTMINSLDRRIERLEERVHRLESARP